MNEEDDWEGWEEGRGGVEDGREERIVNGRGRRDRWEGKENRRGEG